MFRQVAESRKASQIIFTRLKTELDGGPHCQIDFEIYSI